jgi:hypothetical protein
MRILIDLYNIHVKYFECYYYTNISYIICEIKSDNKILNEFSLIYSYMIKYPSKNRNKYYSF